MANNPVTMQELIDAGHDADSFAEVVNEGENFNGDGRVVTRKSRRIKTLARAIADIQAELFSASTLYATIADGLAGTTDGEYFVVPGNGDDVYTLYQNDDGVAVEINRYPSSAGIATALLKAPIYKDPDSLSDMAVNETELSDGSFYRPMADELKQMFAPGDFPRQAPIDLAQCLIKPPTEEEQAYVFVPCPFVPVNGNDKRIMPVNIRTSFHNSPVNVPIFKPHVSGPYGWLTFECIAEKPIHTILAGSITMLLRLSNTIPDASATVRLRLDCANPPHMELGQNNGHRWLATALGEWGTAARMNHDHSFADPCFPYSNSLKTTADTNGWTNLYTGSENGYFNEDDTDEALRTLDEFSDPVGPNVKTTSWMDLSGWDVMERSFYLYLNVPFTRRRRVQVKLAGGEIVVVPAMTNDRMFGGAHGVYRLPKNSEFVRIHYSGPDDIVNDAATRFFVMPPSVSADYDPIKGYWTRHTMNIHREVVFYPGCIYCFNLSVDAEYGATMREHGFRFQSGGMSFFFDASDIRKRFADNLFQGA